MALTDLLNFWGRDKQKFSLDSDSGAVIPHSLVTGVRGAVAVNLTSTDFAAADLRGIYIGGAGDVKVDLADGSTGITFIALAPGVEHAIAITKIYKAGTTATGILALK